MPPQHKQEDRLSNLPIDIQGMIFSFLNPADKRSLYQALPSIRNTAIHCQIKKLEISAKGTLPHLKRRRMFERLSHFPKGAALEELCVVHGSHPEDLLAFFKLACIHENEMMRGVKRMCLQGWDMTAKIGCDCGVCSPGQPDLCFEVACALHSTCPALEELRLEWCDISQDMFCTPLLHNLRKLKLLDLGNLDSFDTDEYFMETIAKLNQLQELWLLLDDSMDFIPLSPLSALHQLKHLSVGSGSMEVTGLEQVLESCIHLTSLDFDFEDCSCFLGPPNQGDLCMRVRSTFPPCIDFPHTPPKLVLNAFQVSPVHLSAILRLPVIRPGSTQMGCVCLAMASNGELGARNTAAQIAAMQEVSLLLLPLLPQGASADKLAQARMQSSGLSSPVVSIDRMSLTYEELLGTTRAWLPALQALQPALRGLCMSSVEYSVEDAQALAQALPTLWSLEVNCSMFLPGAVTALVRGLPSLRKLSLCGCAARVTDVRQACAVAQNARQPWPFKAHLRYMHGEDFECSWEGILVEESLKGGGRVELLQIPKPVRPLRRSPRLQIGK